jgi:hypothetical protein
MMKWILLLLTILWLCLIAVTAVNIYYQFQVTKQQNRILKDYKLISEIPEIFATAQDSLLNDIKLAEQERKRAEKSFPLQDSVKNWLLIRLSVVFLALCTLVVFWLYYRRKNEEE